MPKEDGASHCLGGKPRCAVRRGKVRRPVQSQMVRDFRRPRARSTRCAILCGEPAFMYVLGVALAAADGGQCRPRACGGKPRNRVGADEGGITASMRRGRSPAGCDRQGHDTAAPCRAKASEMRANIHGRSKQARAPTGTQTERDSGCRRREMPFQNGRKTARIFDATIELYVAETTSEAMPPNARARHGPDVSNQVGRSGDGKRMEE